MRLTVVERVVEVASRKCGELKPHTNEFSYSSLTYAFDFEAACKNSRRATASRPVFSEVAV